MKAIEQKSEVRLLQALFYIYAFLIMAWIPRFPEVKVNLGLSNGQFGTLISTGAFGSIASLFLTGHLVHKFGVKRVMLTNVWLMGFSYFFIVRTGSPGIFLILIMAIGWSTAAYHISVSAQAFNTIERIKNLTIARLHGMWALGALITAVSSSVIVNYFSLPVHIGTLSIVVVITITFVLLRLSPVLVKPNTNEFEHLPIRTILSSFKIDWLISGGLLCAVFLEFATGDWSAIFAKERIGVSAGLAALPYILFMSAMIIGRLSANHIAKSFHVHHTVRLFAFIGGFGFLIFLIIAVNIPANHKYWAFAATCLAFTLAGAGSSLMAPSIYTAANRRSALPSAVVIGQVGVVNMVLIFILKSIIAWTAQLTGSLAIALSIPAMFLIATAYFARALKVD